MLGGGAFSFVPTLSPGRGACWGVLGASWTGSWGCPAAASPCCRPAGGCVPCTDTLWPCSLEAGGPEPEEALAGGRGVSEGRRGLSAAGVSEAWCPLAAPTVTGFPFSDSFQMTPVLTVLAMNRSIFLGSQAPRAGVLGR